MKLKLKSHRASAKRFTLTKSGLVKMNHSQHRHNLGLKSAKRKRHLRTVAYLSKCFAPSVKAMIAPACK